MAVTTREARTDLFAIGKGEAQVFDDTLDRSREARAFAERQAAGKAKATKEAAKKLASDKKRDELMKLAAGAQVHGVKPVDAEGFATRSADFRQAVINAIGNNQEINPQTELQLRTMYNTLLGEGKVAVEHKKRMATMLTKADPDKHYLADIEALQKGYDTEGGYGQTYALPDRIDYEGTFFNKLVAQAKGDLADKVYGKAIVTLGDAQEMIANQMLGDPALMSGTKKEMMEDPKFAGKGNWQDITDDEAVTYRQQWAPRLTGERAGFVPEHIARARGAAEGKEVITETAGGPIKHNITVEGTTGGAVKGEVTLIAAASGLGKIMKSALPPTASAIDLAGGRLDLTNMDITDATLVSAGVYPIFINDKRQGTVIRDREIEHAKRNGKVKYVSMAMVKVSTTEEYEDDIGDMKTRKVTKSVLVPVDEMQNVFHKDDRILIGKLQSHVDNANAGLPVVKRRTGRTGIVSDTKFPNAPDVGTIKKGFKFLGGDPNKHENWKKI